MFYKHLMMNNNGEETLYLFIDFNYEFSIDFNLKGKKEKIQTLYENITNYIKNNKINFKMGKVLLVVGGLVIGSIFIQGYKYSELKDQLEPKYQYVEQIDIFGDNTTKENIFTPKINTSKDNSIIGNNSSGEKPTTPSNINTSQSPSVKSPSQSPSVKSPSQSAVVTSPVPNTVPPPTSITTAPTPAAPPTVSNPTPAPVPEPVINGQMVTLYRYNGTVDQIALEEYIVGVVSSEMPASFSTEALKAQSVLARTYALKKIAQNQVLRDDTSSQVYKDTNQLKTLWGTSFDVYYNKVKSAVAATKGEYLTYNGDYIEAVYHSTSNGQTEDSVAVWGNNYSYLKSVDSHWDLEASSYLRETPKEFSVLSSIIGLDFNAQTSIEIISRTAGNRINQIKIDGTVFTGIELRTLLGLRSADFDIRIEDNKAVFVTRGYGHGVGMSQYGANGMAKQGYAYRDILSHYYPGTQIKN